MKQFGAWGRIRRLAGKVFLPVFLFSVLIFSMGSFSAAATAGEKGSAENPYTDVANDRVNFPTFPKSSAVALDKSIDLVNHFSPQDNPYAKITLQVQSQGPGTTGDIYLLLDRSASMNIRVPDTRETRMVVMKRAATQFVEQILAKPNANYRIGIIAFGRGASLLCEPTNDLAEARNTINGISASDDATQMSEAFQIALAGLQAGGRSDQTIIVLTDGEISSGTPNDTQSEIAATLSASADVAAAGVDVYPIGFSLDSLFLSSLKNGSGTYQSALDSAGLQIVFDTIAGRLLYANTEALVTDLIGPDFALVPNSAEYPWVLLEDGVENPDIQAKVNQTGNQLQWQIGNLTELAELSYYIRLVDADVASGHFPVSERADLFYSNYLGHFCLRPFPALALELSATPVSSSSRTTSSSAFGTAAGPNAEPTASSAAGTPPIGARTTSTTDSHSNISSASSADMPDSSRSQISPIVPIPPDRTPMAPPVKQGWSCVNLIFAFVSAALSSFLFVALFSRKNVAQDEQPTPKIRPAWKVLAIGIGFISVAIFFATQNFYATFSVADSWTLWEAVVLMAQLIAILIGYASRADVYS